MGIHVAQPIIKNIKDSRDALDFFEMVSLPAEDERTQEIIRSFPTVYIHNWEEDGEYEVYVGESNDIFKRTRQHYDLSFDRSRWQSRLAEKNASLFIIGHEHFNKSLTLDIENRLMHYMMSVECVKHLHNLRDNPQASYYPMEELDEIFGKIWKGLRKENGILFPAESAIKDSAIYKASPLHKLTKDQERAKDLIIEKVAKARKSGEAKQLIFIDGEAGTGKTVLNSSTFYELYCMAEENNKDLNCQLLVNHDEQITVYEQIAEKLGLTGKYGKVVSKPTAFINSHSEDEPVDVAFVDEAHLLLTQGKQSYRGKNQLKDIIDRARVTIVMFDENQILTAEQFWEAQILEGYRNQAKRSGNHIVLDKQLRMQVDAETMDFRMYAVKRNEDVLQAIATKCFDFWKNNVKVGVPPAPTTVEDVKKLFPTDSGEMAEATNDEAVLIGEYGNLKEQISELESQQKAVASKLICSIGDRTGLLIAGKKAATYKAQTAKRFSSADFKAADPVTYAQFTKETTTRVLRIA